MLTLRHAAQTRLSTAEFQSWRALGVIFVGLATLRWALINDFFRLLRLAANILGLQGTSEKGDLSRNPHSEELQANS